MKMVGLVFLLFPFLPGCSVNSELPLQAEIFEEPVVTQAIITIPTRPGVQQRVLLVQGEGKSRATLLLFPGGDGAGHFAETRHGLRLSNNFLVRSSNLMANESFMAAIVDPPSDRASGMSDGFRTSPQHLRDIENVVRFLVDRYPQPIFLVGTSRSTLSLAYLATALRQPSIRGIIFTSSYDQVGSLPLEQIRYPVLLIHHRDDACQATPYATAKRLYERFTSSLVKDFVTVLGGAEPASEPCEGLSPHGFFGMEGDVIKVMADWIFGKKVPSTIGP
jgi:pimeloyl-ACP methyl ester carboxylesterase